jgi:hypothetical protein
MSLGLSLMADLGIKLEVNTAVVGALVLARGRTPARCWRVSSFPSAFSLFIWMREIGRWRQLRGHFAGRNVLLETFKSEGWRHGS